MSPEPKYDLYSQRFKSNIYETYAEMRQAEPVYCQPGLDGETMIWFVTGYDEVQLALKDDRRFVRDYRLALTAEQLAASPQEPPLLALINSHMLNKDGEDHRRLRGLIGKAFTPKIVAQQRERIQAIADELLDRVQVDGNMDLVEDYAFPLPITVIAELLGVPAADRHQFRAWSNAVVTPDLSPGAMERFVGQMRDFTAYLGRLFAERRRQPQDDLVTALVQAEEAGDQLSEEELFSTVVLLIIAGHETTVSLIANGMLALLQHPAALDRLKADSTLVPQAVEELLRYDGPVERALTRWAAEDVELGGQRISRGQPVILILAAADRDPAHFQEPGVLDIDRQPNPHLAFGRGAHYCLGAPLARLEGEIAINTLLRRLPNLRLAADPHDLQWRLVPMFHALQALPVAWG